MFSRAYKLLEVKPDNALLVEPVKGKWDAGKYLAQQDNLNFKFAVTGGRSLKDENGKRRPEQLLFIEQPDFDVETLIGKILIPTN